MPTRPSLSITTTDASVRWTLQWGPTKWSGSARRLGGIHIKTRHAHIIIGRLWKVQIGRYSFTKWFDTMMATTPHGVVSTADVRIGPDLYPFPHRRTAADMARLLRTRVARWVEAEIALWISRA